MSILLCILLIMFFPSFMLIGTLVDTPRQPAMMMVSTASFSFFCLFTIILTAIMVRRMTMPWYVLLYAEGCISVKGHKVETARWDQVTAIRQVPDVCDFLYKADGTRLIVTNTFLNLETVPLLDLRDADVPRFALIGRQETELAFLYERHWAVFKQMNELLTVMEREVYSRLISQMRTRYQEGHPASFGRLQISREGINNGKAMLLWDEFDQLLLCGEEDNPEYMPSIDSPLIERLTWWQHEVALQDMMRIIGKKEGEVFWSQPVSEIPNAFLLLELVNDILRQRTHEA